MGANPGVDVRPFHQVDVFAERLGEGNGVAVVHRADDLDDETMAGFARWTQLSETTFLCTPTRPGADYRLRIFTPAGELPFAGHPTLGSGRAWLEAGGSPARPGELVQECGAGLVRLRVDGCRLAFAAPPLRRSGPLGAGEQDRLVAALGLPPAAVRAAAWVDNGPGWVGLLLDDAATVLAIDAGRNRLAGSDCVGVIGPQAEPGGADFEVRAFAPGAGVVEDPVTGSLNAGLAQWLVPAGLAPPRYHVAQGTLLGRRGRVDVDATGDEVWVGGATVVGIAGTVAL